MALSGNPVVLGGGVGVPVGATTLVGSGGSSTDNAAARWDGTTGNLIQDSAFIISDLTSNVVTVTVGASNILAFSLSGIAATSTPLVRVSNTTPATSGAPVQMSPRLTTRGNGHDTDNDVSRTVDFFTETLPANGNTVTGTWRVGYSLDGAAATYPMTLTSAGALVTLSTINSGGNITSGGALIAAASSPISWNGRSRMVSGANGAITFTNSAANAGVYLESAEVADPGNAAADTGRLYFRDNGAGKTQLVAVFNTGAVQVIATEP